MCWCSLTLFVCIAMLQHDNVDGTIVTAMTAPANNAAESIGENYIPFRHRALIARLVDWLGQRNSIEASELHGLFHALTIAFQYEHRQQLLALEDLYEPLDPDDDRASNSAAANHGHPVDSAPLFGELSRVLRAAHYHQLNQNELNQAVTLGWLWGAQLSLDLTIFKRLEVFARGYRKVKRKRRRLLNLFRLEEIEFPEFHRLVLAFQLRDSVQLNPTMRSDVVYLKIFKNIPEDELEILLPGAKIKLGLLARGKILIPSLSGVAMAAYKITRGAMLVTLFTLSAVYHWLLFAGVLGFYLFRGLLSYLRTKDKYQFGLTRNLYLKNLDNNFGVIYRLFREAEEQEVCETILVYCLLLAKPQGLTIEQLESEAGQLLADLTQRKLAFDIHDALGKLQRYRLAEPTSDGSWHAVTLAEARSRVNDFFPHPQMDF